MRISDWSSDVCSSDLLAMHRIEKAARLEARCEAPAGFSLARFVDEGGFGCGGDTLITLDATWHEWAGDHLLQAQLSADQQAEVLADGVIRIRATVRQDRKSTRLNSSH